MADQMNEGRAVMSGFDISDEDTGEPLAGPIADAQSIIAAYLTTLPSRGDWEWEDHCEGMASGIVSELRAAGLLSSPVTVLWTGHTEVSMGDDLVNAAGDSAIDLALPVPPGTHVVVTEGGS